MYNSMRFLMRSCSRCAVQNANINDFCRKCGEPIFDPGFEKKVRFLLAKERRRNWIKFGTVSVMIVTVLAWAEYESNTRLISSAVQKAAPAIQAQLESGVQKGFESKLPTIVTEASQQVASRVRQEVGESIVQAARQEAAKVRPDFQTHMVALQAEEDTKLRAVYQQAQASVQQAATKVQPSSSLALASSPGVWQPLTNIQPLPSLLGSGTPLLGVGTPLTAGGAEILKGANYDLPKAWENGSSTTMTLSFTSTQTSIPFPSNSGGGLCFTDKGTMGVYDANYVCKAHDTPPGSLIRITQ